MLYTIRNNHFELWSHVTDYISYPPNTIINNISLKLYCLNIRNILVIINGQ